MRKKYFTAILFGCLSGLSVLSGLLTAAEPVKPAAPAVEIAVSVADGSRIGDAAIRAVAVGFWKKNRNVSISVDQFSGEDAITQLKSGKYDIAIVPAGVMRGNIDARWTVRPYGFSATVLMVHRDNAMSNISVEQLKKLFRGKIKSWQTLNGSPYSIALYAPQASRPGTELIKIMIAPDVITPLIYRTLEAEEVPLLVSLNEKSLGTAPYSAKMKLPENVKLLKINGIEPVKENLKFGKYPLYEEVFLVLRHGASETAKKLFELALAEITAASTK